MVSTLKIPWKQADLQMAKNGKIWGDSVALIVSGLKCMENCKK